ncbi:MAG: Crp/Fnr family transcriptional regulator [Jhaorihella sp.]
MAHEKHKETARGSLFVQTLPEQHVEPLLSRAKFRHFERGETVFLQDEIATGVHVVLDGWVKLYRVSPNGAEAVVGIFARGQSFGEAASLRSGTYPVSAEAVTACEVMIVPTSVLSAMMHDDPEICVSILASTFQHLHSLVEQLEQLKAQTGAQRVAEFLLSLCEVNDGGCTVDLPYDKVLIAGRLGMKPESLSRAFARLKPAGVTIRKNHARIEDVDRLRGYAEEDPAQAWSKPG